MVPCHRPPIDPSRCRISMRTPAERKTEGPGGPRATSARHPWRSWSTSRLWHRRCCTRSQRFMDLIAWIAVGISVFYLNACLWSKSFSSSSEFFHADLFMMGDDQLVSQNKPIGPCGSVGWCSHTHLWCHTRTLAPIKFQMSSLILNIPQCECDIFIVYRILMNIGDLFEEVLLSG